MEKSIDLNDGKLVQIEYSKGEVRLTYINWEERVRKLLFVDVIHFELINAGIETGDFIIETNDEKIAAICGVLEEPIDDYKLFKITCSWGETVLIETIAKDVKSLD